MKPIKIILYLAILTFGISCSAPLNDTESKALKATKDSDNEMKANTLILHGKATYKLGIGYGTIFDLEVKKSVGGNANDKFLSLVIIEENYRELLINSPNKEFKFQFLKEKENFQENRMFESGVVDMNKTAWKLTSIE